MTKNLLRDVNAMVFWVTVLGGFETLAMVLGVQMLDSGMPAGIGPIMAGVVVGAIVPAYWWEERVGGRGYGNVQGAEIAGNMPGELAEAALPGLRGVLPADGVETQDLDEPDPAPVVRGVRRALPGRHRAVRRLPVPSTASRLRRATGGAHRATTTHAGGPAEPRQAA